MYSDVLVMSSSNMTIVGYFIIGIVTISEAVMTGP